MTEISIDTIQTHMCTSYVLVDINTCTDCENVFVNIHEQKTFEDDTQ